MKDFNCPPHPIIQLQNKKRKHWVILLMFIVVNKVILIQLILGGNRHGIIKYNFKWFGLTAKILGHSLKWSSNQESSFVFGYSKYFYGWWFLRRVLSLFGLTSLAPTTKVTDYSIILFLLIIFVQNNLIQFIDPRDQIIKIELV